MPRREHGVAAHLAHALQRPHVVAQHAVNRERRRRLLRLGCFRVPRGERVGTGVVRVGDRGVVPADARPRLGDHRRVECARVAESGGDGREGDERRERQHRLGGRNETRSDGRGRGARFPGSVSQARRRATRDTPRHSPCPVPGGATGATRGCRARARMAPPGVIGASRSLGSLEKSLSRAFPVPRNFGKRGRELAIRAQVAQPGLIVRRNLRAVPPVERPRPIAIKSHLERTSCRALLSRRFPPWRRRLCR